MKLKNLVSVLIAAAVVTLIGVVGTIAVYSEDVEQDSHNHDDGTWTVLEGTNGFTVTLESGNYHLNKDITINRPYEIQKNAVVNICLNGYDITGTGFDGYIRVLTGGELNIYDCQEECGKVASDDNRPILTNGNGKITLYNGSIEHNGTALNDYCISLSSGSTLIVKGGSIYGKQTGVYSDSGTVIVEGGKVEGGDRGIYSKSHIDISGGEVIGGSCGVFNDTSNATMTVSQEARIIGGEKGIINKGTLTVTDGTITGSLYGIDISQSASAKTDISGGIIQGGEYGIYMKYATTLSGAPMIAGDIADFCIMPASASNMLIIKEKLYNEKPYSVYMPNPGVFTKSTDTDLNVTDNFIPAQEHINNGYEIVKNSSGQLELLFNPHIHDDKTFIRWTSSDSLPTEAGSYCLCTDITITQDDNYVDLPEGDLELCLNGHTITVDHIIMVGTAGHEANVSVYDCQEKCGKIVIDNSSLITEILFDVRYGSLTLYNGILESKNGKAIASNNDSATTVEGGTVIGMLNGISVNGGTVVINDGTIEGSEDCGIECSDEDAELIVNGGNISGAWQGLYVTGGSVTVNDGTIEATEEESDGIWCNDVLGSAEIIIKGGTISGDSSGIWILGGTVRVEAGTISGNSGGIWCNLDSEDPAFVNALEVTGGTVSSPSYAVYSGDPEVTVRLSGNPTLSGDIAGIYLRNGAKITISDKLTNDAPYSVGMSQAGVFTGGDTTYNDPEKFEAAKAHSGYSVVKNSDGQLELVKTFTITFDYQGATGGNTENSRMLAAGDSYGELPVPTKTGYIFKGWFTEQTGGKEVTANTVADGDCIIYAVWTRCDHSKGNWDKWTSDDETHSHTCKDCGATETAEHSFGVWTDDENGDTHSRTCVCGAAENEKHTFGVWTDGENGDTHTRACACGAAENEKHTFGVWTDDENGDTHTRTCVCGAAENEKHTFGVWTDDENGDTHTRTCVCGAAETEKHIFGDWTDCGDDENHIRSCKACQAEEKAPHTEGEGEVTKPATDTEKGEMTYKCKDCGYVIRTEFIPASGSGESEYPKPESSAPETPDPPTSEPAPDNSSNEGSIAVDSISGKDAPEVSIDEETAQQLEEEVIAEHLTNDERKEIANGADLDIILSVEDAGDMVPAEDKQAAETVMADNSYILGQYLNIDLLKLINGQQVGKITELGTPISITIEVPEALRDKNRVFAIIRVHDGAAEILADQDNDPNTITILTDRFSTYAIVYQDSENAGDNNLNTGVVLTVAPFIAAAAGVIAFKKRKA